MMTKTQKYRIGLALMTGILIMGLKALQNGLFAHETIFYWGMGACLFFFYCEWITIGIIETKNKTVSPRQSINIFMGLKVGKILLSIFFVMVYAFTVKTEMKHFVLVFLALYLIYLLFDTLYLISREKEAKKKKLLTKE